MTYEDLVKNRDKSNKTKSGLTYESLVSNRDKQQKVNNTSVLETNKWWKDNGENFSADLSNRLNNLYKEYDSFATNSQTKFANADNTKWDMGASAWKKISNDAYTSIIGQTTDITNLLNQYGKYLNADSVADIRKNLDSITTNTKELTKTAISYGNFYSQFKDENQFNTWTKDQNEIKRLQSLSPDELKTEMAAAQNIDYASEVKKLESLMYYDYDFEGKEEWQREVKEKYGIGEVGNWTDEDKRKAFALAEEFRNKATITEAKADGIAYTDASGKNYTYANLYYEANNKSKLELINKDSEARNAYANAQKIQKDIEKLYYLQDRDTASQSLSEQYANDLFNTYGIDAKNDFGAVNKLTQLLDEQKQILATRGISTADFDELYEYEKNMANSKAMSQQQSAWSEFATQNALTQALSTVMSWGSQALSSAEGIGMVIGNLVSGRNDNYKDLDNFDSYRPNNTTDMVFTAYTDTVNSAIANKIKDDILSTDLPLKNTLAWLASNGYSGLSSSAFSKVLASACMAIFPVGGEAVSLAIMASSAASSALKNSLDNGATNGQAIWTGIANGVNEALFEKISLDKFFEMKGNLNFRREHLGETIKNILTQGFVEGSEEICTDWGNAIADSIINGSMSDYNNSVRTYMANGYSDAEAKNKATLDFIENSIASFYGGFIGGAGTAFTQTATNTVNDYFTGKNLSNNYTSYVASTADSIGYDSLRNLAQNVQQKIDNDEKVGNLEKGELYNRTAEAIQQKTQEAYNKALDEAGFKASEKNITIDTNTGKKADITSIASVGKDGEIVFNTKSGNQITNDELTFSKADRTLYNAISQLAIKNKAEFSSADANRLYGAFMKDGVLSAEEYARAIDEGTSYGRLGIALENTSQKGFFGQLTPTQQKIIYEIGTSLKTEGVTNAYSRIVPDSKIKSMSIYGADTKQDAKAFRKSLDDNQIMQMDGIGKLNDKVTNAKVVWYASGANAEIDADLAEMLGVEANEEGKYIAPNGAKLSNGMIFIDVNAGNASEGLILSTASHEFTHYISQYAHNKFEELKNFLFNNADSEEIKRLVDEKLASAYGKQSGFTYEKAEEEVVAEAMVRMLSSEGVYERIAELKQTNKGLWQSIVNFFKGMLKKLDNFLANNKATPQEAQMYDSLREDVQKTLQKLYAEGLVEAGENVAKLRAEGTAEENSVVESKEIAIIKDAGFEYDDVTGTILHSPRYSVANDPKVLKAIMKAGNLTEAEAREFMKADALASLAVKGSFLEFEGDEKETAIKEISDYPQGTIDLTNICTKRLPLTALFNRLQEALPEDLFTADDFADIRLILMDRSKIVACGLCFVEDRRQHIGRIAASFIDEWNKALKEGTHLKRLNSKNEIKDVSIGKDVAKRYKVAQGKFYPTTDIKLKQEDFMSSNKWHELQKTRPDIAAAFEAFNNARGQSAGRLLLDRAEYKREILKWDAKKVKDVNDVGGLRIFSFSDFEVIHLVDLIQIIEDCALKGVKIQGYTKQTAFAKLVSKTGIKLNRSFIPYGATGIQFLNGKKVIAIDTVEGINNTDENFLDESKNPNVSNEITGINDEQIHLAMLDDFFHYIIPFHTNKASDINEKLGVGKWKNYKDYQTDRLALSLADIKLVAKLTKQYKAEGMSDSDAWDKAHATLPKGHDFHASKEAGQVNIYTEVLTDPSVKDAKSFVEKYLEVCASKNFCPRFAQFLDCDKDGNFKYLPGYEKFLVDFKLFDTDGKILPQQNVTANFDTEFINQLIADELAKGKVEDGSTAYSDELYNDILNFIKVKHGYKGNKTKFNEYQKIVEEQTEKSNSDTNGTKGLATSPSGASFSIRDSKGNERIAMGTYFSGGGLADHALSAMVETIFGVEYDDNIREMFIKNNGRSLIETGKDVKDFTKGKYKGVLDYLHGSPVCKNYSNAKNGGKEEPINLSTAKALAEEIRASQPKIVTVENVIQYKNSEAIKEITKALDEVGYKYEIVNVKASDYGNATKRERMFIRAVKDGEVPAMPTKNPYKGGWYDKVSDLIPSLEETDSADWIEERAKAHGYDLYNNEEPIIVYGGGTKGGDLIYATASELAPTITASLSKVRIYMGKQGGGKILEASPRLIARLQGLPDSFELPKSKTRAFTILGNGVPTEMMQAVSKPLLDTLVAENPNLTMYQTRDSEGNELSKEQQEFFKNSKVRDENGNLKVVYHGSPNGTFNEFSLGEFGLNSFTLQQGAGYYFTDKANASQYTKAVNGKIQGQSKLFKAYLNITNPLEITPYSVGNISDEQMREIMSRGNYEWGLKHTDIEKLISVNKRDADRLSAMVKTFKGDYILSVMKEVLGYDGVRYTDQYGDIWVSWNNNQIKETDNKKPTSYPDIRYQTRDKETEIYIKQSTRKYGEVEKAAIEHFGTTDDFRVGGYILRDGTMLDFSGAHWLEGETPAYVDKWKKQNDIRQVDHEDIYEAFDISSGKSAGDNRKEFLNRGNIRMSPEAPGINLIAEPTAEQYEMIRQLIEANPYKVDGFYVDIEHTNHYSTEKLSYTGKVNADTVINDIKRYYATGETNDNSLMRFHTAGDDDVMWQKREDDPKILKFLNDQIDKGEYTTTYKALLKIGDKYYPPMASLEQDEDGKWTKLRGGQELNDWIASEGILTDEKIAKMTFKSPKAWLNKYKDAFESGLNPWKMYGDFKLKKADLDGKAIGDVMAAYNPYQHSSDMVLNDQFEAAYYRPELVVVECRIPNSELTNPYWAKYAKDHTGVHEWKEGPVAGQLTQSTRHVYMTRWIQPVRELSPLEVAQRIMDVMSKEPKTPRLYWNNFNPLVLQELINLGVEVDPFGSPMYIARDDAKDMYGNIIPDEIKAKLKAERKAKDSGASYQLRDTAITPRQILANALESTVQNDVEAKYLAEYKENIDMYNKLQEHLNEVRDEIKELSFAKGKRDANRLKALREDATKTANRLSVADGKLLRLQAASPLKALVEREKAKAMSKMREEGNQRLADYKLKVEAKETKRKIVKIAKDLRERMTNPSERRFIPVALVNTVVKVIDSIDQANMVETEKGFAKYVDGRLALLDIKQQYDNLKNSGMSDFETEYDEFFSDKLGELADALSGKHLRELNADEMEDVYNVLSDIRAMVTYASKQIGRDETISNYEVGTNIIDTMNKVADNGLNNEMKFSKVLREWMLNPMRAAREMSGYDKESELIKLFNDLNDGLKKAQNFQMEVTKTFDKLREGENRKVFNDAVEKPIEMTIKYGLGDNPNVYKVRMTKMQAMQLVLTWEREQANPNRKHLQAYGTKIPDATLQAKGKYTEALEKASRLQRVDSRTIESIKEYLNTEWDQKFMAEARKFFRETAPNAVNSVTVITKHRPVATEKAYIPYEVDKNYVTTESENVKFDATINGMGILKSVKANAPQALVMRGLNSVIERQINDVSKIYGLMIPVRNWNKAINVKQTEEDGGVSVKDALTMAWGQGGYKLLDKAVSDLQGPRRGDVNPLLSAVKSGFVTSTLAGNLSVTMKQAASYPTAQAVLSFTSLAKGLSKYFSIKNKQSIYDEIDKHTPLHFMRRKGLSTQELGDFNQSKGWQNRLNNALAEKHLEAIFPMNWIQAVDVATTAALWEASKADVAERGFKPSDENYWAEVTKTYSSVIEETQPMYDPLHRAEVTKNNSLSNVVMFQTQPLQNSGILREATMELKDAKKLGNAEDIKKANLKYRKAVISQLESHFVFTAMTFIAAAITHRVNPWRDDEEELTWSSFLKEFGKEFGENVFGAIVPVFGSYSLQIFEKVFGKNNYDVFSDSVVDKINTSINAFSKIKNPSWKNYSEIVFEIGSYFGIPARNLERIVEGLVLHTIDLVNGEFGSFESNVERSAKQDNERLYEALLKGNDEAYEVLASAYSHGSTTATSGVQSAIKNHYVKGDIDEETAKKMLSSIGNSEVETYWLIDRWNYKKDNGSEDGYGKYDSFISAVESGANLKATIKTYLDNGVSAQTLASQITTYFKPKYIEMSNKERAAIKGYLLNAYQVLGYNRLEKSKDIDAWLK